jgi:hypothetical protein
MPTILFNPYFGAENATDNGGLKLRNTPIYLIFSGQYWGGGESAALSQKSQLHATRRMRR